MKLLINPYSSISVSSVNDHDILKQIISEKAKISSVKIDKPAILYGAGNLGKMARDFFNHLNLPFLYVVDIFADKYKNSSEWKNIKIIRPDEVEKKDKENCLLVICIVTVPMIELQNKLGKEGWKNTAFFYDVSQSFSKQYPLNNGWFLNLEKSDEKKIEKVFRDLKDEKSRQHYLQFLAWRKFRSELIFKNFGINHEDRFFIPEIIKNFKKEVFMDCGAHFGLVVEKFLSLTGRKYEMIYAIEPDRKSLKTLEKKLKNIPKVKIIKKALSDRDGKGKFYEGFDFSSKLDPKGNANVKTTTLDSLNISPTFIKMHLEGGEYKALKGGLKTIVKSRPMLAITLYHNSDGVFKIPTFLRKNLRNYDYYFRLHSFAGTGAVLYAIPKERN